MAATFDGDNLLMTLEAPTAGVLNQSVEQLYDDAKQWHLNANNRKYPFPFRTTGGDPLTPGVQAGAYFFVQNQDGWRVISSDEDQTINYSGNLVAEDSELPIVVPTPTRTVLHLGLQPVTQRVDDILTDVQFASFNGGVTVDAINGTAGTGNDLNGDPIGTMRVPSDNIPDAVTIAATRGLNQIFVIGNITLDTGDVLTNFVMIGESPTLSAITINAGASVAGMELREAIISGTLDGNSTVLDCHIGTLVFLNGSIHECLFTGGTLTLGGGAQTNIIDCQDGTAGLAAVVIDMGGSGQALVMRDCSGGWEITNKSGAEDVSIDLRSGRMVIDDTVTNGDIILRGLGKWDNKATYVGGANVIDELVDGMLIQDIHGHVRRAVFVDTNAITNGNGYQGSPFDNFTDAVDSAEAAGITKLVLLADAVADRDLKNFTFEGIGSPALDMNSKDFKGSHFISCELNGTAISTGPIRADMCILRNNLTGIDGRFELCGYGGDIFLTPGSTTFLVDGYSTIGGAGRPTIDVGGGGCNVSLRSNRGGMTIKGVDNVGDEVSVGIAEGRLTLDASNIAGVISVRGMAEFTDNSAGSTVDTAGLLNTEHVTELHRDKGLDVDNAKTITENVEGESYDEAVAGVTKEVRKVGAVTTITRQ